MLNFKIRMTRGTTWATAKSEDFVTPEFLKEIGTLLVDCVVFEAKKDLAKQGNHPTAQGMPEGIPNTPKFFDSFSYEIDDQTVVLYSSWPQIDQIVEGRKPYPMSWLLKREGLSRIPMKGPKGTVLIKTVPSSPTNVWIHPGFFKHNFVRRGYERARKQMSAKFAEQVQKTLKGMNVI